MNHKSWGHFTDKAINESEKWWFDFIIQWNGPLVKKERGQTQYWDTDDRKSRSLPRDSNKFMAILKRLTFVVVCWAIGCSANDVATLVKLSYDKQNEGWSISVNGMKPEGCSNHEMLQRLINCKLKSGDAVVLANIDKLNSDLKIFLNHALTLCNTNAVAAYIIAPSESQLDIFKTPIYHWQGNSKTSSDIDSVGFFIESKLLGKGRDGFFKMLESMRKSSGRSVILIGTVVYPDGIMSELDTPYNKYESELNKTLVESKKTLVLPTILPRP